MSLTKFWLCWDEFLNLSEMAKMANSLNQILQAPPNFSIECYTSNVTNKKLKIVPTTWRNQGKLCKKKLSVYSIHWEILYYLVNVCKFVQFFCFCFSKKIKQLSIHVKTNHLINFLRNVIPFIFNSWSYFNVYSTWLLSTLMLQVKYSTETLRFHFTY